MRELADTDRIGTNLLGLRRTLVPASKGGPSKDRASAMPCRMDSPTALGETARRGVPNSNLGIE